MNSDKSDRDHQDPDVLLKDAKTYFHNGEFFRAYDRAIDGRARFPMDMRFAQLAVLSLANASATALAFEKYDEFGLKPDHSVELGALLGRLKKDQAFGQSGAQRQASLEAARGHYEAAYAQALAAQDPAAYYPGINAATLALLMGQTAKAEGLARDILTLLAGAVSPDAPDRYWRLATAIEAYLILGEFAAAEALFPEAIRVNGGNYADLAATSRQFKRIIDAKGVNPAVLAAFEPPTIIHYVGHMIGAPGRAARFAAEEEPRIQQAIDQALDGLRISAAYGSLAAGADILFVEALQARGIAVNIILPFDIDDFIEQSVVSAGPGWLGRFRACLDAAKTVRYATEDRHLGDDRLFTYCSELAMGLAVLFARHMLAPLRQLVIWDGVAKSGIAGTVIDMKSWAKAGYPQTIIRCGTQTENDPLDSFRPPAIEPGRRDTRAMLFGDIHGFSKLSDAQLPVFTQAVMGALAPCFQHYAGDLAFVNTWGDGIFAVFVDPGQAARCALDLQQAMAGLDLAALGLPSHLYLRLGGHLGPVYNLDDPILARPNYFGAHVSRAARIEPITPKGCVYVTETFAAVLALTCGQEFSCDYVGYTEMAKQYGRLRMFLLRRRTLEAGPFVLSDIEKPPLA